MIHITKDQEIAENINLKVVTATGDYEDSALIEFCNSENPDVVAGSFQAQYVLYGSLVYKFNDHIELGTEILKIDPASTHTSASYVRMTNELLSKMNAGSLEPESLQQVVTNEQEQMEEKQVVEREREEDVSAPVVEEEVIPETEAEPTLDTEVAPVIDPVSEVDTAPVDQVVSVRTRKRVRKVA